MTAIPAEVRAEIDKLERKQAENPGGRYFVPLANAYRRAGYVDRAIAVLRQGMAKHPEYVSAHIILGRCYTDQGKMDSAHAEFDQVLSLDPQNLVALRTLGELAADAGEVDTARRWFGQLLSVDPMNEEARRSLDELGGAPAPAMESSIAELPTTTADPPQEPEDSGPLAEIFVPTSFPAGHADSDPYAASESVVTETIAELYTRQGFYDRAIEVYRELIRRKGEEPKLLERLNRVERLAAGDPVDEPIEFVGREGSVPDATGDPRLGGSEDDPALAGAENVSVPADDRRTADPFADSFAEGFPGLVAYPAEAAATREEEDGEPGAPSMDLDGAVDESDSIRGVLQGLLAWRSSASVPSGSGPVAEPTLAPIEVDRPLESPPSADVADTEIEPIAAASDTGSVLGPSFETEPDEAAAQATEYEVAESMGAAAADVQPTGGVPSTPVDIAPPVPDDELFPWELPPEEEPETNISASADPLSPIEMEEVIAPDPAGSSELPTGSSSVTPRSPAGDEGSDQTSRAADDDDLESFQAWLRSLKR